MKTFTEYFSQLLPFIQGYVDVAFEIKGELKKDAKVVGVLCKSLSIVAKDFCMSRVFTAIRKLNLPLIIMEDSEMNTEFKILINE